MELSWNLSAAATASGLLVVFGAGIVRGFAGFGFSALTVAGFSLFGSPAQIVPVALVLEVLASLSLLRDATRGAERGWLGWIIGLNLLCVPLGMLLLATAPEALLRLLVGLALFSTALALRVFSGCSVAPGRLVKAATGVASGLLNGVAASGGVAAAMLMTAARLPATALRSTMIAYLLFAGPYTLLCAGLIGAATRPLLDSGTLIGAAVFAPAVAMGIWLGKCLFSGADPLRYRRFVLNLLMLMAGLGAARAALDLALR